MSSEVYAITQKIASGAAISSNRQNQTSSTLLRLKSKTSWRFKDGAIPRRRAPRFIVNSPPWHLVVVRRKRRGLEMDASAPLATGHASVM